MDTLAQTGSSIDVPAVGDDHLESLLIGRLLCGKWRIERLLGVGGMSVVYAATHRNGNRVAIKVLKPELAANVTVRQRFLREGYIANRVGHEGAAAVLDDNASEDGLFFLVMELVQGETLEAYSQRRGGRLPAADVLRLSEQLLEVLVAAHGNQIVHRDIKPSNVFRTPEGGVKLLDFGIATVRDTGTVSQTASGAVLGTPAFMSPEQARGRHDQIDVRADVWAVGATMFWLLSGRLVHVRATPHETMIATATEPPQPLGKLCPELPKALAAIVDRALKLDAEQRFQSAADLLAALRALEGLDFGAPQTSSSRGPAAHRRWPKRVSVPLATVAFGLLGWAVLSIVPGSTEHAPPPPGSPARSEARGMARSATPSPDTMVDRMPPSSTPSSNAAPALPSANVEAALSAKAETAMAATTVRLRKQLTQTQPSPPPREAPLAARSSSGQLRTSPPPSLSSDLDLSRILKSRR